MSDKEWTDENTRELRNFGIQIITIRYLDANQAKRFSELLGNACERLERILERNKELERQLDNSRDCLWGEEKADILKVKDQRIEELEKENKAVFRRAESAEQDWQSAKERIKELERKIEGAKEIINSQSFWCELADKECVGMKSIVHLVEQALKTKNP